MRSTASSIPVPPAARLISDNLNAYASSKSEPPSPLHSYSSKPRTPPTPDNSTAHGSGVQACTGLKISHMERTMSIIWNGSSTSRPILRSSTVTMAPEDSRLPSPSHHRRKFSRCARPSHPSRYYPVPTLIRKLCIATDVTIYPPIYHRPYVYHQHFVFGVPFGLGPKLCCFDSDAGASLRHNTRLILPRSSRHSSLYIPTLAIGYHPCLFLGLPYPLCTAPASARLPLPTLSPLHSSSAISPPKVSQVSAGHLRSFSPTLRTGNSASRIGHVPSARSTRFGPKPRCAPSVSMIISPSRTMHIRYMLQVIRRRITHLPLSIKHHPVLGPCPIPAAGDSGSVNKTPT